MEPILLDQQLCFSIYQTHKVFNHFYSKALEPFHLTYSQYIVMLVLWEQGQLSVKELGLCVGLDSGTLTPLLKRLEREGWIIRKRSKMDERRLEVILTDKAKAQRTEVYEHVGSCIDQIGLEFEQYQKIKAEVEELQEHLKAATAATKKE